MAYYVHDENHNRIEVTSLEMLTEDTAFKKIKDANSGVTYGFAFVTQAQYNELVSGGNIETNVIYYITDDTTADTLNANMSQLQTNIDAVQEDLNDCRKWSDIARKIVTSGHFYDYTTYQAGVPLTSDISSWIQDKSLEKIVGYHMGIEFVFSSGRYSLEHSGFFYRNITDGEVTLLTTNAVQGLLRNTTIYVSMPISINSSKQIEAYFNEIDMKDLSDLSANPIDGLRYINLGIVYLYF